MTAEQYIETLKQDLRERIDECQRYIDTYSESNAVPELNVVLKTRKATLLDILDKVKADTYKVQRL